MAGTPEDGSVRHLLVDMQVHTEEKATYEAFATHIVTAAGVEEHSQISIDFQPTFQTLVLHHLDIIRDGVVQDRLAAAEIEVIRREKGMENQLYNGALTAHLILKDVRPGDTVSYSFTTRGENPIFKGLTHFIRSLAYSVPVERVRRSFIWDPGARQFAWTTTRTKPQLVEESLSSGLRRLSYDGREIPKFETDKNTPYWFRDFPQIEVTDFRDWEEFGKWASSIYTLDGPLPPELADVCAAIREEGGTPAEQVVKTLRWVQSNIRYLGSFFGEHTHAPYPLAQISARRFGDCKDKGVLTVAMLRHLGFDAAPALVHTDLCDSVREMLPGPSDFDHLIVHLSLAGKDHWLDPTRTFQRGTLETQYSPDYGCAFVIRPGADALTTVLPSDASHSRTEAIEKFDITDDAGNGTLTVTTVSTGLNADNMRRTYASKRRAELEEDYREFYEEDYPGIEIASPVTFTDDAENNTTTITEHYNLRDLLTKPETPGDLASGAVYARAIGNYLEAPESKKRKDPYRIDHPVHYIHTIEVTLPTAWEVEEEHVSASLPSLNHTYRAKHTGRKLTLAHTYRSKADHVLPGDFAEYHSAMKAAEDKLYFAFTYHLHSAGDTAAGTSKAGYITLALMAAIGIFCGCIVAAGLFFWDPASRSMTSRAPSGLAGWLILPVIGCFILPFSCMVGIALYFQVLGEEGFRLFGGGEEVLGWSLYYCAGVFLEGLLLPVAACQIHALLKRRTTLPYIHIGIAVFNLCHVVLLLVVETSLDEHTDIGESTRGITRAVIYLCIWGTYMLVSNRVRATFKVRRKKISPPPLPA